jgi:hypothetical protein
MPPVVGEEQKQGLSAHAEHADRGPCGALPVCRDCNHRLMSGCYCRSTPPHHHQRRRPAVTTVTPCWQRDRRPNWARNERHCQCASNSRSSFETPGTSARPSRVYLANREGTSPQCHHVPCALRLSDMAGRVFAHARTRGPGPGVLCVWGGAFRI